MPVRIRGRRKMWFITAGQPPEVEGLTGGFAHAAGTQGNGMRVGERSGAWLVEAVNAPGLVLVPGGTGFRLVTG